MTCTVRDEIDWRALWDEMLTEDLVNNLAHSKNASTTIHSLRGKMLLKVIFAEFKDRASEVSAANRKYEEERIKAEGLMETNKNLNTEMANLQEKLQALEIENQRLKEMKLKRNSDEHSKLEEKRLRSEVKQEQASFFVPDTNLNVHSPSPKKNLSVPESLSQEEFLLRTPPKCENSSPQDTAPGSPIITVRRCPSSMSTSTVSPAPLSPHNSQTTSNVLQKSATKVKKEKRISKLSMKYAIKPKEEPDTQHVNELETTYFEDDDTFKLFDSPKTSRETKKKEDKSVEQNDPKFGFFRGEVVRKKDERNQLPGWECHDCQKFYENFCDGMSTQQKRELINKCSKHRQVKPLVGGTPEGFWDFGIIESPKQGTTQVAQLKKKEKSSDRLIDKAQAVSISLENDLDWM